jgi:hypothetical protein
MGNKWGGYKEATKIQLIQRIQSTEGKGNLQSRRNKMYI